MSSHPSPPVLTLTCLIALLAPAGCAIAERPAVQLGIDVLIERDFDVLRGRHVGLITNATGVAGDLRATVDILHEARDVQLVALFAPEHGIRGAAYAGDKVEDARDPGTGLPVYSLYGKTRAPTPEMLTNIDTLVFDIQDIGSRSYTYISTMAAAMEAAAEHDIAFVVLDRPNPLGGNRMEGRPLDMEYQSFVGYLPIPYVHGLTVGELARMIVGEGWPPTCRKLRLTVVPMRGWRRDMNFDDTGLHWVPTSPHVPRSDSALFYAATGIMGELRIISEGVGYPLPFEVAAAPMLDAQRLADALNARRLRGVQFRPVHYKPYYASYKGELCNGVQIHLTDPEQADLTTIQFHVMQIARDNFDVELFNGKRDAMFDKVCGTSRMRELFQAGASIDKIFGCWNKGLDEFAQQARPYLLY